MMSQYQEALGLVDRYDPKLYSKQQQGVVESLLSGETGLDPAATNKYFDKYVAAPAMASFDKYVAPRVNAQFTNSGMFSSRQGDAYRSSLQDTNNQLLQQLGSFQLGNQQANANMWMQARQAGLAGANALRTQPLMEANALSQTMAPFQAQRQAGVDASYEEFMRTSPENSPWTQQSMAFIGQPMQAAYNPQQKGGVGGALGGGLGALALGKGAAAAGMAKTGAFFGGPIGIGLGALAGLLGAF